MSRTHKDIKCPVCSSSPIVYREISHQIMEFAADENGIEEAGELESSFIQCVSALCGNCKHEWKLRGVSRIDDIRADN